MRCSDEQVIRRIPPKGEQGLSSALCKHIVTASDKVEKSTERAHKCDDQADADESTNLGEVV